MSDPQPDTRSDTTDTRSDPTSNRDRTGTRDTLNPRVMQWVSGLAALVGLWLVASPFLFESTDTAVWNDTLVGTAIFALARRNGLRAGAICTVDGNLVEGTQKGETDDEELPAKAKDNVGRAIEITLDATSEL
ncbi:MAG: hypothetical protein BRD21_00025 [Halobacteriales archaeon SW_8_66_22]|nr:MAG: hypothetical protein BRD21_00025 [Halobacteriales archaeon SW_8_66_22]